MPSLHTHRTTLLNRLERAGLHPFSAPITGAVASAQPSVRYAIGAHVQRALKSVAKPALLKRQGVA